MSARTGQGRAGGPRADPRHPRRAEGLGRAPGHGRYDAAVRGPVRIALVVLGLAAFDYGTASLTGGWLGTPPRWEREAPMGVSAYVR